MMKHVSLLIYFLRDREKNKKNCLSDLEKMFLMMKQVSLFIYCLKDGERGKQRKKKDVLVIKNKIVINGKTSQLIDLYFEI